MTGKQAAERMLFSHNVKAEIDYGSRYHYSPFTKTITIVAFEQSNELMIANALHEAAHAVQHKREPFKIFLNAVGRNTLGKWFKKQTFKIEEEANRLAVYWLLENKTLFKNLNITWIAEVYYPNNLKAYG